MVRAHRHFLAGQVWHITQRCHQKEFLLVQHADRRRWLYWLYQARRRFGLSVLNYMVTSNHFHLLVQDRGNNTLAQALQWLAQKTRQDYNRRHRRKGDLWQDSYDAAAIQTNKHLQRCLVYMDLNMVRAGVVSHPMEWSCCGYHEAKHPRSRGARIDHASLCRLMGFSETDELQRARDLWIAAQMASGSLNRQAFWSESIAVGNLDYALKIKKALAFSYPRSQARAEADCYAVK